MILFLRDRNNKTLVDVEIFSKTKEDGCYVELRSIVDIKNYSNFLLDNYIINLNYSEIISDFDDLSELRAWLWECYFMSKTNTDEYIDDVVQNVREILTTVADKYDLCVVED